MNDSMITFLVVLGVLVVVTAVAYRTTKRMINSHIQNDAAQQQIIQNGIIAPATIIDIWETGIHIRHNPQLGLRLSIVPPNQAHYVAETKIIATPLQVAQLKPGQAITIHIDPNNPQNIILQNTV